MTLLHSIPTLLFFSVAVVLTACASRMNKRFLSFLGALCAALAVLSALVDGANLREPLIYILFLLLLSMQCKKEVKP